MRRRRATAILAGFLGLAIAGLAGTVVFVLVRGADATTPAAVSIAAGASHTCAIRGSGEVWCWGDDGEGQLGRGAFDLDGGMHGPAKVEGLGAPAIAVAAGSGHTCALLEDGRVACWGSNASGQLGDGESGSARPEPAEVAGLEDGAIAVSALFWHTCALTANGEVWCWGDNTSGQLGDGTTEPQPLPVRVPGVDGRAAAVAAGQQHTCALAAGGRVLCWGGNGVGQLGDGTTEERLMPVEVRGLPEDVTAIAAGHFTTCAVTQEGGVWCWGLVQTRGLSDSTALSDFTTLPVQVTGLERGAAVVEVGVYHACALMEAGGVRCWGSDDEGQIGDGEFEIPAPTGAALSDVEGLAGGVEALAVGAEHTCARLRDGGIRCWGHGYGWVPKDVSFEAAGRPGSRDE